MTNPETIPQTKELESFDRELDQRIIDGLTVTMWWQPTNNSVYVTVDDFKNGDYFSVDVPLGIHPNQVFDHPFAYRVEDTA